MNKMLSALLVWCVVLSMGIQVLVGQTPRAVIDWPGIVAPVQHSISEIKARAAALEAIPLGPVYQEAPRLKAPHKAGTLHPEFVAEGLATLNFARYLAGLPDLVREDAQWATTAQHGAVLLRIINKGLSHQPAMPAGQGISKDFYKLAYAGTSSSNLDQGAKTAGAAIRHFLDDSDASNIDRLGHRRWVLSPGLVRTAIGFADPYLCLQVFDAGAWSAPPAGLAAWVAWPVAGDMPIAWFGPKQAWSLSLDPAAFGGKLAIGTSGIKIVLKRSRDGRVWNLGTKGRDGYFNLERSGFGLPFCLIFRPDGLESLRDGDSFAVSISGLEAADGQAIPVMWTSNFFSLGPAITHNNTSRHPAKTVLTGTWQAQGFGLQKIKLEGKQGTFGYVGVPLTGFSWLLDGPDGIAPIGFRINGQEKIFGPGEWVAVPEGITRFSVISADIKLKYAVFNQSQGWSSWLEPGQEAAFGTGQAIETISIILD